MALEGWETYDAVVLLAQVLKRFHTHCIVFCTTSHCRPQQMTDNHCTLLT